MNYVPCAGTPIEECTSTNELSCDDGDDCTENDIRIVEACDNTVECVPCTGTPIEECTSTIELSCDDGDDCTENDIRVVEACDNSVECVPCEGTMLTPECGDSNANNGNPNATCIDDNLCTYDYCGDPCFQELWQL